MERQYFKTCGGGVSVTPGARKAAAREASGEKSDFGSWPSIRVTIRAKWVF